MHISGKSFDTILGDLMIHVEEFSASISDNRKATMTSGVPDDYVDGDVSCTGEMTLDSKNFNLVIEAAGKAGSFRDLEPFDITTIAKTNTSSQKFELFGCLLTISDLLAIDPKGGEKTTHKLPFEVTSPDFVRINGVPYLSPSETDRL